MSNGLAAAIAHLAWVILVEEHNINGGEGSIVAEVLAENGSPARLQRLGVADGQYAIAGDRQTTRERPGIDADCVRRSALMLLKR